jgi:hypothetical protein
MKIFDEEHDRTLELVTLYLERAEVQQLVSYLEQLLEDPSIHHIHLGSPDFQRDLTVAVFDPNDAHHLETFDERSKKVIREDS